MIKKEEIVPIGKFQKTHALKGELNMISKVDPEYFREGNPIIIYIDGILVPYYVESVRPKGSTSYLVRIQGLDNEREASEFVNKEIYMLKKDSEDWLKIEEEEEHELIGYKVIDAETGLLIGTIKDIEDSTVNMLFIIEDKDEEIYVPVTEDFIKNIDKDKREIFMNLPEGLVDINK